MKLKKWLNKNQAMVTREEFCRDVGITKSYLYQLLYVPAVRPGRRLAQRIELATEGQVTRGEMLFPEDYETT